VSNQLRCWSCIHYRAHGCQKIHPQFPKQFLAYCPDGWYEPGSDALELKAVKREEAKDESHSNR
jgi:hypothetical protein